MAMTNFAALTDEQLTVWQRRVWRAARNKMFIGRFLGTDDNAMIHRITELKRDEKGARAVITLVHDLEGDGVAGDRFLEGNEEEMKSSDQVIRVDMLRNGIRHEGRMADQKSVVKFRTNAENNLSYWLGDRYDQKAFLTLSGVSYAFHTDGRARVNSDLPFLEYAADVTAPTAKRYFRWDDTTKQFVTPDTSAVTTADTPSYEMLINLKALAYDSYLRPVRTVNGVEWFNVFMTARGMARLKLDEDFKKAYREALPRTPDNPIFKGTDVVWLDGMAIYTYRHVFNTRGLAAGSKWGATGEVDGQAVLLCGAQALALADVTQPFWDEEKFDYKNQPGIAVGKIGGLLKPRFFSIYDQSVEDFSVMRIDTAI